MSVVKKYQGGGASPTSFKNFALQNINKDDFTPEALQSTQQAIELFDRLAKEENINEVFSIDPLTNTYTVNVDKIKNPELKSIDWSGTTGSPKKGFFGTYTSKDIRREQDSGQKKFMGVAADLLAKYMKSTPATTVSQSAPLRSYGLGTFEDFITNTEFGGQNLNFDVLLSGDFSKEAREKKLIDLSKKALQSYINQSKLPGHSANEYTDLTRAQEILSNINNPNISFEQVRQAVLPLGWNLLDSSFYEDPATIEAKKQAEEAKVVEDARQSFLNTLAERGIPTAVGEQWYAQGWRNVSPNLPEYLQNKNLTDWFTKSGGFTISDETGSKTELITPSGNVLTETIFDLSSPLYGTYLGKDAMGKIIHYTPGVEGYINPDQDQILGQGYRNITGTVNGQNWEILGVPQAKGSQFDYTTRLLLRNPVTDDRIEVYRDSSGLYRDAATGDVMNVKLQSFTNDPTKDRYAEYFGVSKNLKTDAFKDIPVGSDMDFKALQNEYNRLISEGVSSKNINNWIRIIGALKYKITASGSAMEREKAGEDYANLLNNLDIEKLTSRLPQESKSGMKNRDSINQLIDRALFGEGGPKKRVWEKNVPSNKQGGILKAQRGAEIAPTKRVSWEEYVNKVSKPAQPSTEDKKIKDWGGTLKDMSELEKASLLATAASVLPVVGVIGGLASAGINTARMLKGEDVGLGTIAMDLGFAGLGLVGLGGIGAAVKAGKIGQKAGKIALLKNEVKTAAEALEKVKATLKPEVLKNSALKSALEKVAKGTGSAKNMGITADELKALKEVELVKKNTNLGSIIGKEAKTTAKTASDKLKDLAEKEEALKVFEEVDKTKNIATKVTLLEKSPKLAKAAKYGQFAMMAPGALAVPSIVSDVSKDGLGAIKQEDLRKLIYAGALGYGGFKNMGLAKDIKSLTKMAPGKTGLQIDGKRYDVDIALPKETKPPKGKFFGLKKPDEAAVKSAKDANETSLKTFKEEFEKITGTKLPDNFSFSDAVKITDKATPSDLLGEYSKEAVEMGSKRFARAMKAIESERPMNYFRMWKKGGIVKGQEGLSFGKKKSLVGGTPLNSSWKYAIPSSSVIPKVKNYKPGYLQISEEIIKSPTETLNFDENIFTVPIKEITLPEIISKQSKGALPTESLTLGKITKEIDPLMGINLGILGSSGLYNERIRRQLLKGSKESFFRNLMIPRVNIPFPTQFNPLYQRSAAETRSLGRRLGQVADVDKGMAVRLSGEKSAQEALLKGDLVNQENINRFRAAQADIDYKNLITNIQSDTENKARAAKIAQNISLINAEALKEKAEQFNKFLGATGSYIEAKRLKKEQQDYLKGYMGTFDNPRYNQLVEEYKQKYSDEALKALKESYEKQDATLGFKAGSWEESNAYKQFQTDKQTLYKQIENLAGELQKKQLAYRMGINSQTYKKGGSIEDKFALERMKSRDRFIMQRQKYYQDILKNKGKMKSSLLSLL